MPDAIPWQNIANLLFAGLMVLGGYLWTQTASTVASEKKRNEKQDVEIARLQEWRLAQDETIRLLREELKRMNEKLDRLLSLGRPGSAT